MKKAFFLGALGYPLLELLWRGRSHYSMSLAGGIACLFIAKHAQQREKRLRPAFLCALEITAVEYLSGMIFNRRHHIWDYRRESGHFAGQVCPRYTLLWFLLSACAMKLPCFRTCRKRRPML